jgi:hypothetical protein
MKHKILHTIAALIMISTFSLIHCGGGGGKGSDGGSEEWDFPEAPSIPYLQFSNLLNTEELGQYLNFDPIKTQRCALPDNSNFQETADALGGFKINYKVPLKRDSSLPFVYSGFPSPVIMSDNASPSVTIERADLVAQNENRVVYLSKKYGLFAVEVDEENTAYSKVSCALTLPGRPVNFYWHHQDLFIITNGLFNSPSQNAAVLRFSVQPDGFTFVEGLLLPDTHILDTRRFNDTLAIYGNYYPDLNAVGTNDNAQPSKQLHFVSIVNQMKIVAKDFLTYSDTSYYNNFVSASDRYLVVPKTGREITGYKTKTHYRCTKYGDPILKTCCYTKWKRIPNPDYTPASSGGVVGCGKNLWQCLKQKGPKLSPYIRVNDGQKCHEYEVPVCVKREAVTQEYPIYKSTTEFVIYRYQDGAFIKLDETLGEVINSNLVLSDHPLKIDGTIPDHNFLKFQNGFFYALTANNGTLTTFTIQGNSLIKTSELGNLTDNGRISTVRYSDNHLYYNEDAYGSIQNYLESISLDDPAFPKPAASISIPGVLHQILFYDDHILGFGNIRQGSQNLEKISLFSETDGSELDNYLVGADLSRTSSPAAYDEQVYNFDSNLGRFFLPVNSNGFLPGVGYEYLSRLAIADIANGLITTPKTIEFPESIERVASLSKNTAVALSPSYIHQLGADDEWNKQKLLEILLPASAYPVSGTNWWIVQIKSGNAITFNSTNAEDIFSATPNDTVNAHIPQTHVCAGFQIYYGKNTVLLVSEKQNQFTFLEECPETLSSQQIVLKGWQVDQNGKFQLASQEDLEALYEKVKNPIYCVTDVENEYGQLIPYPEELPEEAQCMTEDEFWDYSYE